MTDEFCRDANIFWYGLGLYAQFADRLLDKSGKRYLNAPPDIVSVEDEAMIRQMQAELHELEATISNRHKIELSRVPPDSPSVTLHECNRLMVIATVLGSLGMRFQSTVKTIEESVRQRERDEKAKRDAKKDAALRELIEKLGIDPKERGAAGKIHKETPDLGSVRTINRRLNKLGCK